MTRARHAAVAILARAVTIAASGGSRCRDWLQRGAGRAFWSCRPITPAIPTTGSSGGTTPAISTRTRAAGSDTSSRSSASASIRRPSNPSRWTVRDLFMAHFAITDMGRRRHGRREAQPAGHRLGGCSRRMSTRSGMDDWSARLEDGTPPSRRGDVGVAAVRVDLVARGGQAAALHGDPGYSRKAAEPGNASHYYSLTRMPTARHDQLDGEPLRGARLELDGSRVRYQLPRTGPGRLGLVLAPAG